MATQNKVSIGLELTDNGSVKKTIKSVEDLHSTIQKTQKAAANGVPVGGTAGSRRVAAAGFMPSGAAAAAEKAEITEYGRMRGTIGGTGASARDFANQAQGLGGLVRLYATYAANIFAVSAAFNALSRAMDTTNMVRGLDQLGAASGTALGGLSKRLVQATDGAISLREAMEATAKASSSGMSSEQILRMGQVAKQASQALGVDMGDAISRISRGITKLEPELLDELGLFTKTGQAAAEYAKSVGKSVTQLTDFERRAAFANAVLEEGERKFGSIKLDTNPYTQLLASIKNLGQEALELVNKVIGPLVGYLSASPAALTTAIGGLAAILLKQALPAIGEFKAGLASAAEAATELSVRKAEDAAEARKKLDSQVLQQIERMADEKVARVDEAEQKILNLEKSGINKRSAAYKLLQKDIDDVTEADFAAVEARARAAEKAGRLEQASSYREVIAAVKEQKAAEEDLIQTKKRLHAENMKAAEGWGVYGTTIQAAQQAQINATKATIVSNAAYNGSLIGVRGALSLMREEIANSDVQLTKTQRTLLLARGGFAAVGGAISTLVSRLGTIGMVAGLVTAAFSLVDSAFTKNSQEASKLSNSIGRTEDSLKNLGNTLDFINKKPFLDQMSPESLSARATALREVSDSIAAATDSLLAADKAASGWDKFIDGWKSLWGGDMASKFAESTSKGLFDTFTKLSGTKEAETLRKELGKILSIDPKSLTLDTLEKAIESAAKSAPEKLKQVKQAFDDISKSAQISAAKSTELIDSFKKLDELRTSISNSFNPKDDLTKFGIQLVENFQKLSIALEDPEQRLNAIRVLAKEITQIPGTGLSDALGMADLAKDAEQAQRAQAKLVKVNQDLIEKEAQLAELIGDSNKARKIAEGFGKNIQIAGLSIEGKKEFDSLVKDLNSLKASKEVTVKVVAELTGKIDASVKQIESAQLSVFKAGAKIVSDQLSAEWAKAGTTIANAYASVLSGTETGIKMRANADRAVINAQIAQIESQRSLTIATRELAIQMKEAELRKLKENSSGTFADRAVVSQAEKELEDMRKGLTAARAGNTKGLVAQMAKELSESQSALSKQSTQETLQFAQSMEASGAAIANLRAQIAAINIGEKFQQFELQTKIQAEALQNSLKSLEVEKESALIIRQKNGEYSEEYIQAKQSVEQKILAKQQELERLTLTREILKFEEAGSKVEADKVRTKLAQVVLRQKEVSNLQKTNQELETIDVKLKRQQQGIDRITKLDAIRLSGTSALVNAEREISEIVLDTAEQTGKFTKEYLSEKRYELAIAKSVEEQKRAEDAATYSARITQLRLAAEYEAEMAKTGGVTSDAGNFILSQMAAEAEAYGKIVTALNEKATAQNNATTSLKLYNDEQAKFAKSLEGLKGLDVVFDGLGTKITQLAEAFKAAADSQKQYSASIADMEFERDAASTAKERISWENKISKAQQDQKKDEIAGYAKSVGAAKAMFKEKTTAYKSLAALEKVLHVQRLAMDLKEMVQKLFTDKAETVSKAGAEAAQTASTGAGFLARTGTYISEIFAKFSATMGPWGWAAAAAVVAAIFGGGGKSKGSFVPTAEQRQQTQGTAMSWDSQGNKVQTSRGVFGDTEAKSQSIVNSLEIIRDNSIDGLDYDNKMLRALTGLKNALDSTAKGLYGITGLRAGSLSGVVEGVNTSGGFLGIGGLFSKSVSKSIIDSGIKLSGSLKDLIDGISGSIQTFETVSTTVKKSGFFGIGGSTKTSVSTSFKNLEGVDQAAFQSIVNAFGYAGDLLYEVADAAGVSANKVTSVISSIRVDELASLRGLTGEDFAKELSSVIGKVLDNASYAIFTEFEQFAEFGEGMLETVVRVVDTNKKINQALINTGRTGSVAGNFQITEALADAAGGLDIFLDRADFFRRNFLTEEEQLAPTKSAVTKELSRLASLGYTSADGLVDTRAEFKKLVQTLELDTSPAAIDAYTSLMAVAEGFYDMTEATETALQATIDKFKEFADNLREFRDNLVLGSQSILTPLQKYSESKLQFETTYTKALAGDEVAQGRLTGAAQTFLSASKDYFASSAQYTQDFNSVLDKIGVGITESESQISIAERQLNGITDQVGLLTQINKNIAYIAGVPQAATGGRVSGLTFVGERGPELVNFTSAATVYSADQTRGMFANPVGGQSQIGQVVTELVQLRKEVTQLRKEQQQQTGDLITSNYDANSRAAQAITSEISETSTTKEWAQRNQVVVV